MEEYISKNKFQENIKSVINDSTCPVHIAAAIQQYIEEEPTADVTPVVHGKWVKEVYIDPYGADWTRYHCSLCGRVEIKKEPYCNCGAKMDLTDD